MDAFFAKLKNFRYYYKIPVLIALAAAAAAAYLGLQKAATPKADYHIGLVTVTPRSEAQLDVLADGFARRGEDLNGDGQELGLRSGTENLPAIAAMALAAQKSKEEPLHTMKELSDLLLNGLRSVAPSVVLNGEGTQRHPGILNLRFPGISGEEMAVRLDLKGICVSPGAACGARDPRPSHVLLAMGCTETQAKESVRFSLGRNTTEEEINTAVEAVGQILRSARKEV